MRTLIKINGPDLKTLDLKGIEIMEYKVGNGNTDFKGIELRDTVTNAHIRIEMGPYSDINVFVDKPKEYEDKFSLSATLDTVPVNATFDTEAKAQEFAESKQLINVVIKPVKVEKL